MSLRLRMEWSVSGERRTWKGDGRGPIGVDPQVYEMWNGPIGAEQVKVVIKWTNVDGFGRQEEREETRWIHAAWVDSTRNLEALEANLKAKFNNIVFAAKRSGRHGDSYIRYPGSERYGKNWAEWRD